MKVSNPFELCRVYTFLFGAIFGFLNFAVADPQSGVFREVWSGIGGSKVSDLTSNELYPKNPVVRDILPEFRATAFGSNYGTRLRAWVVPAQSGSYRFWIAGDDYCELRLSSDDTFGNASLVASVPGYTSELQWTKYSQQKSELIPLVAGKIYFIEALHKEGTGGDHVAVAWELEGGFARQVIPGGNLIAFESAPAFDAGKALYTSAGADFTIYTPAQGIKLSGSVHSTTGQLNRVAYAWTQISGATVPIADGDTLAPSVSIIEEGNYVFEVAVTQGGVVSKDRVTVVAEGSLVEGTGSFLQEFWLEYKGSSLESLSSLSGYPGHPQMIRRTAEMRGPKNWADQYVARTRGYITPPETGSYTFYVSGDDEVALFLSGDESSSNAQLMAFSAKPTGEDVWTKYSSQKSVPVNLVKGQSYYCELLFREGWSGDYHSVAWSRGAGSPEVITGEFFVPITPDEEAPGFSTDATFLMDAGMDQVVRLPDAKAFLNGKGARIRESFTNGALAWSQVAGPAAAITSPASGQTEVQLAGVGTYRFKLTGTLNGETASDTVDIELKEALSGSTGGFTREVWLDVNGGSVSDLENDPDFPSRPDITEQLSSLVGPENWGYKYGAKASGYLIPNRTGPHRFYLSADESASLRLSTDSSPNTARIVATSPRVSRGDYRYPEQVSAPIDLVAGERYYIEVRHKQYWGGDYFQVAWSFGDENSPTVIGGGNLEPRVPGVSPANAGLKEFANAGVDKVFYLPTAKAELNGAVMKTGDADPFKTTTWSYLGSNPSVAIADPNDLNTSVALPGEGTYTFRLTLSSGGRTHFDDVAITIRPALSAATGGLLRSVWLNVSGSTILNLLEKDPDLASPSFQDVLPNFSAPKNWTDRYGTRLNGYLHAPATGDYRFHVTADDNAELWLSSDRNPGGKQRIVNLTRYTPSDRWDYKPEQTSAVVRLEAGKSYYIEALHKEYSSSDHVSVAWSGPVSAVPEIITAGYLEPFGSAVPHSEQIMILLGANRTILWPDNRVDLLAQVYDHNDGPSLLTYQWSASQPGVAFSNAASISTSATFPGPGSYELTLAASDGVNSAQRSLTVLVQNALAANAGGVTREVWMDVGGYKLEHFTGNARFPGSPDFVDTLMTFEAPVDWGDQYGQRIRGYILPPARGLYEFYVAGDDYTQVSINTANEQFDQMTQIISQPKGTSYRDFTRYPTQKSEAILLEAGRRYPIEVLHMESKYGDHVSLAWKRPGVSTIDVISGAFLAPAVEAPLAAENIVVAAPSGLVQRWPQNTVDLKGIAVDLKPGPEPLAVRWEQVSGPGSVTFTVGTALETNAHVSAPGVYRMRLYATDGSEESFDEFTLTIDAELGNGNGAATRKVYSEVKGSRVIDLVNSEKYPNAPDVEEPMARLDSGRDYGENYGQQVAGQLFPPTTGLYRFSVAGDDWAELWLSDDSNPENRRMICFTPSATDYYEWDKYPEYQTSLVIYLEQGSSYYIEIRHKESGWRDHFSVAWLRPGETAMEIVEGAYLAPIGGGSAPAPAPKLTLRGAASIVIEAGSTFVDPGATAVDGSGNDITSLVLAQTQLDTSKQGAYSVRYQVVNPNTGFAETIVRTVNVVAGAGSPAAFTPPTSPTPPAETWTEPAPGAISAAEASRFLAQATFGPTKADIARVQQIGYSAWISEQIALPVGSHLDAMRELQPLLTEMSIRQGNDERLATWWTHAISGQDQLRQRVAFALSEILVISDRNTFTSQGQEMANYYDILVRGALGDYRQMLEEVTLNPMMGQYLTMLRSSKLSPDENYPREVMQLFSIGLNDLNPDGSAKLDGLGRPIPSYGQAVILELSRAFTGWTYAGSRDFNYNQWDRTDYFSPMMPFEDMHDTGSKTLMGGFVLPAGLTAMQDLERSLDHIAGHPNVGPFLARRLIQRLVTSNPTPGYIYRVAKAFDNDGSGRRGNLAAVARAILLDPEARAPKAALANRHGKLREPIVRLTHLLRAFDAGTSSNPPIYGRYPIGNTTEYFAQAPLQAPSVFNFFEPDYAPPGSLQAAGLVAPEFSITTEITAVDTTNDLHRTIDYGARIHWSYSARIQPKLEALIAQSSNRDAVIDELNLLLMGGTMTPATRAILKETLDTMESPSDIAQSALKLVISSPEFSIQK